jgi:hypothetical protein
MATRRLLPCARPTGTIKGLYPANRWICPLLLPAYPPRRSFSEESQ